MRNGDTTFAFVEEIVGLRVPTGTSQSKGVSVFRMEAGNLPPTSSRREKVSQLISGKIPNDRRTLRLTSACRNSKAEDRFEKRKGSAAISRMPL